MNTPHRIIDANANRAREALRVLEEAARFALESQPIASQLKTMRHDLVQALPHVSELIAHRDTPGDVGTKLTTPTEYKRSSISDVVSAAGARLSEALRAIEEYAKVGGNETSWTPLATTAEQIRYQSYDITQRLVMSLGGSNTPQWRLCLLLTESLCTHHPWQSVLEQALDNGVDAVQVREKEMDGGALLERVKEVQAFAEGRAAVIVNDRPDVALLAGAQGVHLGQADLSPLDTRRLVGSDLIIGVSTSSLEQASNAREQGADYCGVGPMFATTTKHKPELAGPEYLKQYLDWDGLPHLAIGGITANNINELAAVGCRGIAVSSAICSDKDPAASAKALVNALSSEVEAGVSQTGMNAPA